jgi:Coenzyme PQQ synthesis protein D (PqqD)
MGSGVAAGRIDQIMNPIDIGSVLGRRADVRFRVIDAEGVVVRQGAGEVLVLNDIGTRILALADGVTPVTHWIDTLLGEFEVARPVLERDVLAFAVELVEQGLLEPLPASRRLQGGQAAGGHGGGE